MTFKKQNSLEILCVEHLIVIHNLRLVVRYSQRVDKLGHGRLGRVRRLAVERLMGVGRVDKLPLQNVGTLVLGRVGTLDALAVVARDDVLDEEVIGSFLPALLDHGLVVVVSRQRVDAVRRLGRCG